MSLSTRRPAGIPSSVRPPRSSSAVRGRDSSRAPNDSPPLTSGSDNKYRTQTQSQRSRSVPRQGSDNPYRSRRAEEAPPLPHSSSSRHSVQSSVSSSSSGGNSVVSAASTAPSSIWDYVGLKSNGTGSGLEGGQEERSNEVEESHAAPADGSTIWSRVAAVAGGLSINVSKAWDAKDDLPEPDTPPGHDSRVTTALKKHYIKQVSDPRQLPAWLFSDIERQVGRSSSRRTETVQTTIERDQSHSSPSSPVPTPVRARARHEDAYAQPQTRERSRTATYDEERTGPTRAATRLRALRDARRGPMEREREVYVPPVEPEPMREPERVQAAPAPVTRPRVGLPPRPGRVRRD